MKKRKRPLAKRPLIRILIIWAVQTVALIIMALLMDSVYIEDLRVAITVSAMIGLLNALLWTILSYIIVPFAVLILAFILNVFIVWLAAQLVTGFDLANFWAVFWLALGMAAINIILSTLLTFNDDNS